MFESLQEGLGQAFRVLRGKATLSESNMREGMELVRQALLEADVSYSVVQNFVSQVSEKALGEKVLKSLNPSQQLVGVVFEELVNLMGPVDHSLHLRGDVTILMLCGLQGSGKTTTCGKLGRNIKERGGRPLLVAADLQRPAAIQQLQVLGEQLEIPVFADLNSSDPVDVCHRAVEQARKLNCNVVILDTAGRLHIDEELMEQLRRIDRKVEPEQVYLVVDGMTGQDAVNSAKAFNDALELDGVIMTKLDGDARGGAALSVKSITGVPIKFIGTGEHLDALEEFHPDRMAQRILGMGDVLTLVEQAQKKFDQDEMLRQQEQLRKGEFSLDDFDKMIGQLTKLGPLQKVMKWIPGLGNLTKMMENEDADQDIPRLRGIIHSMTPQERRNPTRLIDQSRRRRIAAGAGVEPSEVNQLVKQFDFMAAQMKKLSQMGMMDRAKAVSQMEKEGLLDPTRGMMKEKGSTGKRLSPEEKRRQKKMREREERRRRRNA